MRALLKKNLEDLGSKRDWSHITSQVCRPLAKFRDVSILTEKKIGMFAYTGLTPVQMDQLAKEVRMRIVSSLCKADSNASTSMLPRMAAFP